MTPEPRRRTIPSMDGEEFVLSDYAAYLTSTTVVAEGAFMQGSGGL